VAHILFDFFTNANLERRSKLNLLQWLPIARITLSDLTLGVSDVVVQAEKPAGAPVRGYMQPCQHCKEGKGGEFELNGFVSETTIRKAIEIHG
jgi:hypothetical protein